MWRSSAAPPVELLLLALALAIGRVSCLICTRRPANTATPKSPVDENYVISVSGNPETYILGQEYNGEREVIGPELELARGNLSSRASDGCLPRFRNVYCLVNKKRAALRVWRLSGGPLRISWEFKVADKGRLGTFLLRLLVLL